MSGLGRLALGCGPTPPGMTGQRILAIRGKKRRQFQPLFRCETGAHADVLQCALAVEQSEEQRAYRRTIALLMPAKPGDHAIAFALMFHFEHHALVRLIKTVYWFGHYTVQARTFKSPEPVGRDIVIASGWRQMNRRCGGGKDRLQLLAPGFEGLAAEIAPALGEQIEEHDRCRAVLGQH